jgi:NitT/TauT family transport system permease protein
MYRTTWQDLGMTLLRTLAAFIIGAAIGAPLGLGLGLQRRIYDVMQVPVDFIRSIPVTALFPVAMIFFGIGDSAKLATVTFACALIILVNSAGAVRNLDPTYAHLAQLLRLSAAKRLWSITLPAALPEIANGLRVAASISLILVIVLEMFVGSDAGLGRRLYDDQQLFRVVDIYSTLLLIGFLGYGINAALVMAQHRWVHWAGR